MRALILNSGMGKRMGNLTDDQPKCMTTIVGEETILSRQLKLLEQCGIKNVIITTGLFNKTLEDYCFSLGLNLDYTFVFNPDYSKTNYIYSIYLARQYLDHDVLLMHGDLVFEHKVLKGILKEDSSSMVVSSTIPLPDKDFKAIIEEGLIKKVGVEFFDKAVAAQPLYRLNSSDWKVWLDSIIDFCENGQVSCYAENALNVVSDKCYIHPFDVENDLCAEIDTMEDLLVIRGILEK